MKKQAPPTTNLPEEAFSGLLVVMVLLVLPQLGSVAMMIGSVIGLSLYVALFPDRFRTRSGSLKLAIGLVTFLTIGAVVVLVMALTDQIK